MAEARQYTVLLGTLALEQLEDIPKQTAARILDRISGLSGGLGPQVKRLTNFDPPYRLRVGDYRVLFRVDGTTIQVHSVVHRRDAYR